jgi:acetolactate synthase small subunit
MYKTISAKVDQGIDALVRVTNTLRRKEFQIRGLKMTEGEIGGYSDLMITIEEGTNLGIEQAMMQLRKIINVYEIKEFNDISEEKSPTSLSGN